jgi:hypothetical protein
MDDFLTFSFDNANQKIIAAAEQVDTAATVLYYIAFKIFLKVY